jgi:hypothetical protein
MIVLHVRGGSSSVSSLSQAASACRLRFNCSFRFRSRFNFLLRCGGSPKIARRSLPTASSNGCPQLIFISRAMTASTAAVEIRDTCLSSTKSGSWR